MSTIKASFAGSWYPANSGACEQEIRNFLALADHDSPDGGNWCGAIVPHAGWFFSGRIACGCIHRLATGSAPDVVAVLGVHMTPRHRPAMITRGSWQTPLGDLPVNETLASAMRERFPELDTTLPQDNTIELQLPFIRYFWPHTTILPMGVPPRPEALTIGTALAQQASREGLVLKVVGSTDLTHYGPNYGFAPAGGGAAAVHWAREENDRRVIEKMVAMEPQQVIDEALDHHNACCPGAAAAAIACGRALGARSAKMVAYASSYDRHRDESFVGYTGIVF